MEWTEDIATGFRLIDDDHRRIIEIITCIERNVCEGDLTEANRNTALAWQAIAGHFAAEEKLMKNIDYGEFQNHKNDHDFIFRSITAAFLVDFDSGQDYSRIAPMLLSWVKCHIDTHDRKLAGFIREKILWIDVPLPTPRSPGSGAVTSTAPTA